MSPGPTHGVRGNYCWPVLYRTGNAADRHDPVCCTEPRLRDDLAKRHTVGKNSYHVISMTAPHLARRHLRIAHFGYRILSPVMV